MVGNRSIFRKRGIPFIRRIDILSRNRSTVRVYPHHNDFGFRKVWEAGAWLTEYLIKYPDAVRGRSVMEVGSGVGLTGLVVAGLCRPSRVSITDFTNTCLTNMAHNVEVFNRDWLEGQRDVTGKRGTLTTVISPWGLFRCPIFWSMMPRVCPYIPPRAPPQKYLSFTPSWGPTCKYWAR